MLSSFRVTASRAERAAEPRVSAQKSLSRKFLTKRREATREMMNEEGGERGEAQVREGRGGREGQLQGGTELCARRSGRGDDNWDQEGMHEAGG